MNINEEFVLTELWSKKLKDNLRSASRAIYFTPPTYLLLNAMFCIGILKDTNINFWTIYIPLTIATTLGCILLPLRVIRRYNNVIERFQFISATELKVTLINQKTLIISNPEFKDDFFTVSKTEKVCKTVISNSDKRSYTIIPECFTQVPIF